MKYFFGKVKSLNPTSFDSNVLLPIWYNTDPVFKMSKLENLLGSFIEFNQSLKDDIINAFLSVDDISKLFEDSSLSIPTGRDFGTIRWKTVRDSAGKVKELTIADFLSQLFGYLYNNQLSKKDSSFCKKIDSNLALFYKSFVKHNAIDFIENMVCPYCGLEKIRDEENIRKPDHDHLLPKGNDLFVFSSVNSKNLFPSGTDCNIIKDTAILLYSDDLHIRCKAFYPYSIGPHPFELYNVSLECIQIPNFSNSYKGDWKVKIIPNDPEDVITAEKIQSWDRVFKITSRYAKLISTSNKSYIDKELNLTKIQNVEELVKKIKEQRDRLPITYFMLSTETEVIPRKIFYEWAINEISYLKELMRINIKHISGVKVDLDF
ncbi:hypothetical protein PFY10_19910 [Chryseobacterium daecheongense]|nr:hypothetical protein PFY10_19910 [Chryseobacterium daecheongense]